MGNVAVRLGRQLFERKRIRIRIRMIKKDPIILKTTKKLYHNRKKQRFYFW